MMEHTAQIIICAWAYNFYIIPQLVSELQQKFSSELEVPPHP